MFIRGLIGTLGGALMGALLAAGAAYADPGGTWLTQGGKAKVDVARCGANLCGTVVWQKTPGADKRNPDPAKRDRPVIGIQMLYGMAPSGQNQWSGTIYNPENGKTYNGKMTVEGNTLTLSSCAGLFCGSEKWTRSN